MFRNHMHLFLDPVNIEVDMDRHTPQRIQTISRESKKAKDVGSFVVFLAMLNWLSVWGLCLIQ